MRELDRTLKRRITHFSAGPLLNLLTPFLVLPVLANSTDTAGWAELAIGQSVGSVAAGMVAYGWQIVGPVEIARADSATARRLYAESLVVRLLVLVPMLGVVVGVCAARAPGEHPLLASGVAASVTLVGLSPSWVSIGLGRPGTIVVYEALPRVLFLVGAATLIAFGGTIWLYPGAMAAGTLTGAVLFSTRVVRPAWTVDWIGGTRRRLRSLAPTMAATTAASLYSTGALLLIGLVASTQATAEMASADRLFRIGLVVVVVLANALQAWVVHASPQVSRQRRRRALQLHAATGVTGLVVFALSAPSVAGLMFGDSLAPSYTVAVLYGAVFACQAVQISLVQHLLIPAGRSGAVLVSTLAGAGVGVPTLLLLARIEGAEGGAAALAISEGLVLTLMVWFTRRPLKLPTVPGGLPLGAVEHND